MARTIEILDEERHSSYFGFYGIISANHEREEYEYADDRFIIEEGNIECFLYYFLLKYFDGDMPINYTRPFLYGDDKREFMWWADPNYYTVDQIEKMLEGISSSADLLENDYDRARKSDFTQDFSIFYMTDDEHDQDQMPREEAIKKNIGVVIDFYRRFVARMKKLIECDPKIQYIEIIGP